MSRAEAVEAVGRGIRLVQEQKKAGVGLLATGEMGIGNTTTSSAVAAVLLGQPVEGMTGRGRASRMRALPGRSMPSIAASQKSARPCRPAGRAGEAGRFRYRGALRHLSRRGAGRCACAGRRLHQRCGGALRRPALPGGGKGCFASHCSTEPAAKLVLDALNKKPSSRRASIWAKAPARWPPSRCGTWRWPSTMAVIPLKRAASKPTRRREVRDADAGARRRGQRKERLRREPCA